MHSHVLMIILAAVVVLIVIVVLVGLRYLRADEDYEIDDEPQSQPARTRARTDQSSPRRGSWPGDNGSSAVRAREDTSGRPAAGRGSDRPETRRSAGPDREGRPATPDRDHRSRQDRGHDRVRGDLVPAGSRPARGSRDDDVRSARAAGGDRDVRDRRDAWDFDGERANRSDRTDRSHRGDRSERRELADEPVARADDRSRRREPPSQDRLPAVRPRPSRGKRDGDGDWPSTDWDELSDVDYWAELASDRPLPAAQPTADIRADRTEPRRDTDPGAGRGARGPASTGAHRAVGRSERAERAEREPAGPSLPSRRERRPEPMTAALPDRRSERDTGSGTGPLRGRPAGHQGGGPAPGHRQRRPGDDDPLTSPSFPRVSVADSRSYRRERSDTQPGALTATPAASASGYTAADWAGLETAAYPRPTGSRSNYLNAPTGPYQRQPAVAAAEGYPAEGGVADHLITGSYAMPAGLGSGPLPPGYSPETRPAGYGSPAAGAGYPAPEPGPASYPPQPTAPASYGHESGGYSSAVTAAFPVGSDPAEATPGYPGYGATGPLGHVSSGQHARPPEMPYLPPAYGPAASTQDTYSGQFPYPAPQPGFGSGDPGMYSSPYDAGGYVQARQPVGGYPSTDPYARDLYGYPDYGR